MKLLNEEITSVENEEVGNGQILVCGMSCGGICLLLSTTAVAAAFATMTAALY